MPQFNPQDQPKIVLCFWILIGLVSLAIVGRFIWQIFLAPTGFNLTVFILILGGGVSLICALLWIAHVTHVHILDPGTATAIWLAFIVHERNFLSFIQCIWRVGVTGRFQIIDVGNLETTKPLQLASLIILANYNKSTIYCVCPHRHVIAQF